MLASLETCCITAFFTPVESMAIEDTSLVGVWCWEMVVDGRRSSPQLLKV